MSLIAMSQMYRCRPSEILHIDDEYTAFCLDEACAVIRAKLDNKEQPIFKQEYNSFSQLYRHYE